MKLSNSQLHYKSTEPTGVEPCLGGTVRASGEQEGAGSRSSACHSEVVTTETAGVR